MKIKGILTLVAFLILSIGASAQPKTLEFGLKMFTNNEQIVYCVPLPLKEFKEVPAEQRAIHSFVNRKNEDYTIDISGFYIQDEKTVTIDTFYNKINNEQLEEKGKIITQKQLIREKNCFFSIGYYNNLIDRMEFLEITWVKDDELVKLEINYPIKEKVLWEKRRMTIIENATCK